MKPTVKSYFSGAGGMDLGLSMAGLEVIQSLEIDKACTSTLEANFSHKVSSKDIKDALVLEQEKSDILAGTWPCTKYSAIADIHGTRTGDELFLHFFRHIAIEKPEMYIVENVPGMKKFKVVMEAITKLPDYYINMFCPLDALNWLPQKRERLIVIGTRKPFNMSPPKEMKRVSLKDIVESCPEMEVPSYVLSRIKGNYRDKPIIVDPEDPKAFAPTCVAHYSKDKGTRLVMDKSHPEGVRPFTVREYARLQGFPDSFEFPVSDSQAYKQIGNAVPPLMAEWIGKQALKYFN